ncbi:MAG: Proline--tRNA ligase [Eubacteriales bacterium SKADARSKE-1]|nr:Proline--tRNA ligase [Eubacteriales bacterium SKADARSKE-1]
MLISSLLGERLRSKPAEASLMSHVFLLRGGYVRNVGSGIYSMLTPALRVQRKIEAIIRSEMEKAGGQEVLLPVVLPGDLWKESGRFDEVGSELLRFKDRGGRDMLLAMTHEEAVVHLARSEAKSYLNYPFMLYQIQTKFRDEPRARGGLIRVREFTMKDAYSFHTSIEDLEIQYERMYKAYTNIYERAGLPGVIAISADNGMMGGSGAHEFVFLSDSGEDSIVICEKCGYKANAEIAVSAEGKIELDSEEKDNISNYKCSCCGTPLKISRGIEVGHIFKLGDKYTTSMNMTYTSAEGKKETPIMGCYGIGVGRLLACVIEASHDDFGPIWPKSITPWQIHICALNMSQDDVKDKSFELYNELSKRYEVLLDDRNLTAGAQFADADLLGIPVRIIISKRNLDEDKFEVVLRENKNSKKMSFEELGKFLSEFYN